MRKTILFVSIILSVVFTSCDFNTVLHPTFNEPVKNFFKEYTENAVIEEMILPETAYIDEKENNCIDSTQKYTIQFNMRNPQGYSLVPSVKFESLDTSIDVSEITIEQTDLSTVIMTLPQSFLADSDEGKNISPTVSLYEPRTGRTFVPFTGNLYCNTKPTMLYNATILNDNNTTFALAFDMPESAELALRNKDLTTISINGKSHSIKIDEEGNFSFTDPEFTSEFKSTYTAISGKAFVTTDRSVFYATGDVFSNGDKEYTITLTDEAGLISQTLASTKITKLVLPDVNDSDNNGLENGSNIMLAVLYNKDYHTIKITPPTKDHVGNDVPDTTVHYTLYQGTRKSARLYESGTTKEEKTLDLTVGTWYLEAYAEKTNYENSAPFKCDIRVIDATIFISENGSDNDDEADGTEAYPYKTVAKALSDLRNRKYQPLDYIFSISGNIEENAVISGDINGGSLTLAGKLKDGTESISTVSISTEKPVILRDIKVTQNLNIAEGTSVSLKNDAIINKVMANSTFYMESNATAKEVQLKTGAYISISDAITSEKAATIIPENYTQAVKLVTEKTEGLLKDNYAKFAIKQLTDGTKCIVDKDGTLLMTIEARTVEIIVDENRSDISVKKTQSGSTVTFTAATGFQSYKWIFEDSEIGTTNKVDIDTSSLAKGWYDITLLAKASDGTYHSFYAQLRKED